MRGLGRFQGRTIDSIMTSLEDLTRDFYNAFPDAPSPRFCRAPGRINLLGEHLDYNGLPVLPMTIDRDICIGFSARDDGQVHMHTRDPRFPRASFLNESHISPSMTGAWENYCKAALQALNTRFAVHSFPGMNMCVEGDIPMAAGLSSSSALVVACALAYLAVLDIQLGKDFDHVELASLLAEAEQYVGTKGGMDQAIILLGGTNQACKIDFFPLRVERVPLFEEYAFVACHSLVSAPKTGGALTRYNEGPLTCRILSALVEKEAQREFGDDVRIERLGDLWYGPLCLTHSEAADLFEAALPKETYRIEDIAARLDMPVDQVRARWLGDLGAPEGGFRLKARARHQLSEFQRVEAGRDLLLGGDAEGFGALMNDSHESCARDYGVSCPELDELVAAARQAGALGSRLTGAGFGGYTVSLVPRDRMDQFQHAIHALYYARRPARSCLACDAVLVSEASNGADYV